MSVGRREIAWIGEYATPKGLDDQIPTPAAQNDPEAHIGLLGKYLAVAPYLLDVNKRLVRSALLHADLHSSNLFVDGGHITAVIDWQESWAGPLMLQAKASSPLVNYEGEILLKRPENFHAVTDEEKTQIKNTDLKVNLFATLFARS